MGYKAQIVTAVQVALGMNQPEEKTAAKPARTVTVF
jgi:hypothetical protein